MIGIICAKYTKDKATSFLTKLENAVVQVEVGYLTILKAVAHLVLRKRQS